MSSLRTHTKKEIIKVSDMNPLPNEMYPRHENMNPDVGNRHL
jgi:hypothetical protein